MCTAVLTRARLLGPLQAAGDSMNKSERKEQVLAAVQARREAAMVLRTEAQRLKFEAKRQNIERMKRVAEYEHQLKVWPEMVKLGHQLLCLRSDCCPCFAVWTTHSATRCSRRTAG